MSWNTEGHAIRISFVLVLYGRSRRPRIAAVTGPRSARSARSHRAITFAVGIRSVSVCSRLPPPWPCHHTGYRCSRSPPSSSSPPSASSLVCEAAVNTKRRWVNFWSSITHLHVRCTPMRRTCRCVNELELTPTQCLSNARLLGYGWFYNLEDGYIPCRPVQGR